MAGLESDHLSRVDAKAIRSAHGLTRSGKTVVEVTYQLGKYCQKTEKFHKTHGRQNS